ncbi:MAG: OmpH family outer membrane protein [Hydrogenophilales bacterium]|nr:OmpH family outer membrane protein [Hydrogenophilales bacterium]
MQKILLPLLFGLLLSGAAMANDFKFGYINTQRVFQDSPMAKSVKKKLELEFSKQEQDIQKSVKQARELQTYLEKEGLTIPEADRTRKERELATMSRDIQRTQREFREDLNRRQNEEYANVHDRARKVIREIAEKEKFDLIVETAVYASPRVDITERVLKVLER